MSSVAESFTEEPTFRPCTDRELKPFQGAVATQLAKVSRFNLRNHEIAEALYGSGDDESAMRLEKCHQVMSGKQLSCLQPTFYCQKTLLCGHCAALKAAYRAEQMEAALSSFGEKVSSSRLRTHKLFIKPDTAGTFDDPFNDLAVAVSLLTKFKSTLGAYHGRHNSKTFVEQLGARHGSARELKARTLGPTLTALHLVPRCQNGGLAGYAHLHITIYTDHRTSQKSIKDIVTRLWKETIEESGHLCEYDPAQVGRPRQRQTDDSGKPLAGASFSIPFDSSDAEQEAEQTAAMTSAAYLSRPLKPSWTSDTVLMHYRLLERLKLKGQDLSQFLGKEGTARQRLPSEFDPTRLDDRFIAEFTGSEWYVTTRLPKHPRDVSADAQYIPAEDQSSAAARKPIRRNRRLGHT